MAIARVRPFPPPPAPAPGPWTAADVKRFPDDGYRYEIWHGELVRMAPAGGRHGECEANLVAALRQQTRELGRVYTGDTGFLVVEIRSSNGANADAQAKLSLYLEVGVPLVWIVDPQKQTVEEVRASAGGFSGARLM